MTTTPTSINSPDPTSADGGGYCPTTADIATGVDSPRAYAAVYERERASDPRLTPEVLKPDRVMVAASDTETGPAVAAACGDDVAARTFVVYTRRTDMGDSESLSQGRYWVSHSGTAWFVWAQPH
ncbi:MAG: hypothetical protein QOJ92_411 [Frankiales bacterium]|nr:hypothetical protein [Frankiales bacterium]